MDIPVFLFTGFLDGGKTTFIQSLLMDKEFNKGQTILVLQCEEGEEELDLSKLPGNTRVFTESIDEEDALSEELLLRLQKKYKPTRIMVEYNGMWMLDSLFEALPENWAIAGETLFLDSTTFLSYNTNMRQLDSTSCGQRNWCFLTGSQSRQTRWLCTKSSGQYPVNAI